MAMAFENFAFNGDKYMDAEFEALIRRFAIKSIFETGTYKGITTRRLARHGIPVHTVEVSQRYFSVARKTLRGIQNAHPHFGSSVVLMRQVIHKLPAPTLFFLDAHWGSSWPVHGELEIIADMKLKPCIAIHDFKVPDTDLGFDSFRGRTLDWAYIQKHVEAIYGPEGYHRKFNSRATGARRGVVYITPREDHKETSTSDEETRDTSM